MPQKSDETSSSSLTLRTRDKGERRSLVTESKGASNASLFAIGLVNVTVKSTSDTLLTGTRTEMPALCRQQVLFSESSETLRTCELAGEVGKDELNGGGGASGRRDDVGLNGAPQAARLLAVAVEDVLRRGGSVHCSHHASVDAKGVVEDLCEWCEAVRLRCVKSAPASLARLADLRCSWRWIPRSCWTRTFRR